jgi:hypothetical protein
MATPQRAPGTPGGGRGDHSVPAAAAEAALAVRFVLGLLHCCEQETQPVVLLPQVDRPFDTPFRVPWSAPERRSQPVPSDSPIRPAFISFRTTQNWAGLLGEGLGTVGAGAHQATQRSERVRVRRNESPRSYAFDAGANRQLWRRVAVVRRCNAHQPGALVDADDEVLQDLGT